MQLEGHTALVTGGARRVGRAIVLELARRGADLVVHHRDSAAAADEVATRVRSLGRRATVVRADLTDVAALEAMVAEVEHLPGGVDLLVNSAAGYERTPVGTIEAATFDALYELNLRAPLLLAQALAPGMRARGGGRIVMITDVGGERPWPAFLPYGATKAGLIYLTRGLARALAPEILVNAVSPGTVLPPDDFDDAQLEAERRRTLVGRLGTPEEVARAVAFLLESDFTTGQVLAVDGGKSWR
jgi:NAD(P)-dependent dehydrogenase (short-subunit alcohol dehydrogenase family)